MIIWIKIGIIALAAVLYLWCCRYYMAMFQQNSYKADRYLNWLKSSPLPRSLKHAKVKFVFTARMKRLALTLGLLFILCSVLGHWAAVLCAILSPFVLLMANCLVSPVEKAITRSYYKDAQRILAEHKDLIIIGVTGSFGKTSTKHYLHRILSEKYNVLMTPGNFNTTLGVVRTIREQLEPFHQVFIVEMGAKQPGDIKEICDLVHPAIGIVTAVGKMHLETFGSFENIQKTKFELINALPANGLGVINMESEGIASYKDIPNHCPIITYGIDAHRADCRGVNISYSNAGMEFDFITKTTSEHFKSSLLGDCNVLNLCAALCVAQHLRVPVEKQRLAVSKIMPVEHRLSIRRGAVTILDDAYNSNPDGAAMALSVLRDMQLAEGAVKAVITPGFVEMGQAQAEECKKLGFRAAKCTDILVIVNKHNREAIHAGALEGGMEQERIILADNLTQAQQLLAPRLTAGSVVLYENDLPDTFI